MHAYESVPSSGALRAAMEGDEPGSASAAASFGSAAWVRTEGRPLSMCLFLCLLLRPPMLFQKLNECSCLVYLLQYA